MTRRELGGLWHWPADGLFTAQAVSEEEGTEEVSEGVCDEQEGMGE